VRNAKWFVGIVLGVVWMSASAASEGVAPRDPVAEARVTNSAHESVRQKSQQMPGGEVLGVQKTQQASQGKTRAEVKRELAVARASGCMDVPDSQYPQPCPLPDGARSVADAFQMR
jgi:Domain of unknown function (DUF4148)